MAAQHPLHVAQARQDPALDIALTYAAQVAVESQGLVIVEQFGAVVFPDGDLDRWFTAGVPEDITPGEHEGQRVWLWPADEESWNALTKSMRAARPA